MSVPLKNYLKILEYLSEIIFFENTNAERTIPHRQTSTLIIPMFETSSMMKNSNQKSTLKNARTNIFGR